MHYLIAFWYIGWVRGTDPSRLLHYEGGGSRTSSTDIVCPMYMRVWDMLKIAKDESETRPLILCEYACFAIIVPIYYFLTRALCFFPLITEHP